MMDRRTFSNALVAGFAALLVPVSANAAKTIEVDAGHLSMIVKPEAITGLILEAAGRKG